MQNRTRLDEELLQKSEKLHKGGKTVRETPRSWEGVSVKEKIIDFHLSGVSTEQAQRVDTDRGNRFRDWFTPWDDHTKPVEGSMCSVMFMHCL